MITRCKFLCVEKAERHGNTWSLKFAAVTTGSEENKEFWKWTPFGTLEFQSINKKSTDMFEVGKEYYLDLTASI